MSDHNQYTAGGFGCPICGQGQPHQHTSAEIAEHRVKAEKPFFQPQWTPCLHCGKPSNQHCADESGNGVYCIQPERALSERCLGATMPDQQCFCKTCSEDRAQEGLTDEQLLVIASESGVYKKTQLGCTFDPCKILPFARSILARQPPSTPTASTCPLGCTGPEQGGSGCAAVTGDCAMDFPTLDSATQAEPIGTVVPCEDYGVTIRWAAGVPRVGTDLFAAPAAPLTQTQEQAHGPTGEGA